MSAVDENVDVESIEHLDFAIACTVWIAQGVTIPGLGWIPTGGVKKCGEEAVSEITCRVCGTVGYCCESHRALIGSTPHATCVMCNTTGPGLALFAFVPLVTP